MRAYPTRPPLILCQKGCRRQGYSMDSRTGTKLASGCSHLWGARLAFSWY